MGPSAYAPATTVSPKARETPRNPIPRVGKAPASTALPQPPRTRQSVPRNSLVSLGNIDSPFAASRPSWTRSSGGGSKAGRRTFGQDAVELPPWREAQVNAAGAGRQTDCREAAVRSQDFRPSSIDE